MNASTALSKGIEYSSRVRAIDLRVQLPLSNIDQWLVVERGSYI
jgi:hypothetical protein